MSNTQVEIYASGNVHDLVRKGGFWSVYGSH